MNPNLIAAISSALAERPVRLMLHIDFAPVLYRDVLFEGIHRDELADRENYPPPFLPDIYVRQVGEELAFGTSFQGDGATPVYWFAGAGPAVIAIPEDVPDDFQLHVSRDGEGEVEVHMKGYCQSELRKLALSVGAFIGKIERNET